jgi:hypothetical protein
MSKLFEDLLKNYQETLQQMNMLAVNLGELLLAFREDDLYLKFGNDVKNWNDFLNQIGMSYAEANKYMKLSQIMSSFGDKIPTITPNRLKKIIKYFPLSEISLEGWFALAELAPQADFNAEIDKIKGKKDYAECTHEETEELLHCKKCNRWLSKKEYPTHEDEEDKENKEAEFEAFKEKTGHPMVSGG